MRDALFQGLPTMLFYFAVLFSDNPIKASQISETTCLINPLKPGNISPNLFHFLQIYTKDMAVENPEPEKYI